MINIFHRHQLARMITRWLILLVGIVLLYGCGSPPTLNTRYIGNTPPASIQSARIAIVHVAKNHPNQSLEEVAGSYRSWNPMDWGKIVKGVFQDSVQKMQIDHVYFDAGYGGSADLLNLTEQANQENAAYLLIVESDVRSER